MTSSRDKSTGNLNLENNNSGNLFSEVSTKVKQLVYQNGNSYQSKYLSYYGASVYVNACVTKRSQAVSAIELRLFEITNSQADFKPVYDHPFLDLINKPNNSQSKNEFIRICQMNKDLAGEFFVWKVRDKTKKVKELLNLRPDKVIVYNDNLGQVWGYEYRYGDIVINIQPDDMIHGKHPSPLDNAIGLSPLSALSSRVESENYASQYQKSFFENDASPRSILTVPDTMDKEDKDQFRKFWNSKHKGKSGTTAVISGDVKYQQVGISQKEMDYIETLRFIREDILVAYQVPKELLGASENINRATAEIANEIFLSQTVKHEMEDITKYLENSLLSEYSDKYFLTFIDPTPKNAERLDRMHKDLVGTVITVNEARDERDLPAIEGGDVLNDVMSNSILKKTYKRNYKLEKNLVLPSANTLKVKKSKYLKVMTAKDIAMNNAKKAYSDGITVFNNQAKVDDLVKKYRLYAINNSKDN